MMLSSGTLVMPGGTSAPTLDDIAIGLCRAPRFAGHTNRWWPVLLHSIVCFRMARDAYSTWGQMDGHDFHRVLMHALMHDAHESVLSDVPKTWKPKSMEIHGDTLDGRIFDSLEIPQPSQQVKDWVKAIDVQALAAEANLYGPDGLTEHESIPTASPGAIEIVASVGRKFDGCDLNGLNLPAMGCFKNTFHSLKTSITGEK